MDISTDALKLIVAGGACLGLVVFNWLYSKLQSRETDCRVAAALFLMANTEESWQRLCTLSMHSSSASPDKVGAKLRSAAELVEPERVVQMTAMVTAPGHPQRMASRAYTALEYMAEAGGVSLETDRPVRAPDLSQAGFVLLAIVASGNRLRPLSDHPDAREVRTMLMEAGDAPQNMDSTAYFSYYPHLREQLDEETGREKFERMQRQLATVLGPSA